MVIVPDKQGLTFLWLRNWTAHEARNVLILSYLIAYEV